MGSICFSSFNKSHIRGIFYEITINGQLGTKGPAPVPTHAGRSVHRLRACGRQVAPWHRWVGLSESKFAVFVRRRRWDCLSRFRWLTFYLRGRLVSVFRKERTTLTAALLGGPVWSSGGRDFPPPSRVPCDSGSTTAERRAGFLRDFRVGAQQ